MQRAGLIDPMPSMLQASAERHTSLWVFQSATCTVPSEGPAAAGSWLLAAGAGSTAGLQAGRRHPAQQPGGTTPGSPLSSSAQSCSGRSAAAPAHPLPARQGAHNLDCLRGRVRRWRDAC